MKKIYILVEVDLQSYGYSAKNALVFTDIEKAKEKMREMYLEAFKKYYGEDDDPYAKDNYDYDHMFNIIMDYVLMFPLKMGMAGAALATAAAKVTGDLLLSFQK